MKLKFYILSVVLSVGICVAQNAIDDFISILNSEGGGERAVQSVQGLPTDQKSQMLQSVVQRIQTASQELAVGKSPSINISNAALLLAESGTDDQIIAAFGNLSQFGPFEPDAAFALAACREPAGVAVIDALARKRLPNLERAVTPQTEDDKQRLNEAILPFFLLIKEIAASANPAGQDAAKQLREDFATRYNSKNGKLVLAAIDAELAKVAPRQPAVNQALMTSPTNGLPNLKPLFTPKASASKPEIPSDEPTSSTPWSVTGVLLVVAVGLAWLVIKSRKCPPP